MRKKRIIILSICLISIVLILFFLGDWYKKDENVTRNTKIDEIEKVSTYNNPIVYIMILTIYQFVNNTEKSH